MLPPRLSALQILGFADPDGGDWGRLRALQYAGPPHIPIIRGVSQLLAAVVTFSLFADSVSLLLLTAWFVAIATAVWNWSLISRGIADVDRRVMTREEFRRHAISSAACGLVWALALLLFAATGERADDHALWTIVVMLIAGSAATSSSAPLTTVMFAGVSGVFATLHFLFNGEFAFSLMVAAFICVVIYGTIDASRTFIAARIAEAGAAEKDEVVSLLLREFEENEADWLWQIDVNRLVRSVSPRFAFALGVDPQAAEGRPIIELISGEAWRTGNFPPSLHDLLDRLTRRENFSSLLVEVEVAAGRQWWELSGTLMLNDEGEFAGFRGVGSDVTEQRESNEKIAYLARFDTLTGLPNRLMLTEALADALRYTVQWRSRCAFLMIDLDRFKSVNDSLGHQIGDQLLAQVARRLQSVVSEDIKCGRLGGDEFAIVIRDTKDHRRVEEVAQTIIERLSEPYEVENHTLFIGASVGSAIGPQDGTTVETLMRNADLALYRVKDEGGSGHFRYEPSLHASAEERRKLELSLRQAVGKRELELTFQPVVGAYDENLVSFEALVRWNSEEHGFVSPGKFIPLAEDTRLIVPIGEWVLLEACRQAARWPRDVRVAVNVSGEQLLEPGFSQSVIRALADSGLAAHRLEVEVTESIFLRDGRTARQTLEEIMALGCSVALDDFGTGYSSLGYLRTLRFSTIKVDQSFIQGAGQGSQESLAIIRAVVAMAQSLEMTTTAEGAETLEQVEMIRALGCDKIQGYYFGRPMQANEALALIERKAREAA